jgi:hypothetical protein
LIVIIIIVLFLASFRSQFLFSWKTILFFLLLYFKYS